MQTLTHIAYSGVFPSLSVEEALYRFKLEWTLEGKGIQRLATKCKPKQKLTSPSFTAKLIPTNKKLDPASSSTGKEEDGQEESTNAAAADDEDKPAAGELRWKLLFFPKGHEASSPATVAAAAGGGGASSSETEDSFTPSLGIELESMQLDPAGGGEPMLLADAPADFERRFLLKARVVAASPSQEEEDGAEEEELVENTFALEPTFALFNRTERVVPVSAVLPFQELMAAKRLLFSVEVAVLGSAESPTRQQAAEDASARLTGSAVAAADFLWSSVKGKVEEARSSFEFSPLPSLMPRLDAAASSPREESAPPTEAPASPERKAEAVSTSSEGAQRDPAPADEIEQLPGNSEDQPVDARGDTAPERNDKGAPLGGESEPAAGNEEPTTSDVAREEEGDQSTGSHTLPHDEDTENLHQESPDESHHQAEPTGQGQQKGDMTMEEALQRKGKEEEKKEEEESTVRLLLKTELWDILFAPLMKCASISEVGGSAALGSSSASEDEPTEQQRRTQAVITLLMAVDGCFLLTIPAWESGPLAPLKEPSAFPSAELIKQALEKHQSLQKIRYTLVPEYVSERLFWLNFLSAARLFLASQEDDPIGSISRDLPITLQEPPKTIGDLRSRFRYLYENARDLSRLQRRERDRGESFDSQVRAQLSGLRCAVSGPLALLPVAADTLEEDLRLLQGAAAAMTMEGVDHHMRNDWLKENFEELSSMESRWGVLVEKLEGDENAADPASHLPQPLILLAAEIKTLLTKVRCLLEDSNIS